MNKSHSWFENNVIYRVPSNFPGAGRRVYPGFLQHTGFVAMNPSNHARSHYDYFKDLIKGDDASTEAHRKFYDEYNAVLDMDANYYLETIKVVFQDFSLVNGTWDVKSVDGKLERVRPQDITTTALLSVEGELDDISGSGQTEAVHSICSGVVGFGAKAHDGGGCRALRHFQRAPLARDGLSASESICPRASARSGECQSAAPRRQGCTREKKDLRAGDEGPC